MTEEKTQNISKIHSYARNVVHYYIDPVTGERKEKHFDDGPFNEVKAKIKAFKESLKQGAKDKH